MPANGSLSDYTGVKNCSCAACDSACPAPPVDASIGFFDGFNVGLVAIVYGALIVFTVIFQVVRRKYFSGAGKESSDEGEQNEDEFLPSGEIGKKKGKININDSAISSSRNSYQLASNASAIRLLEGNKSADKDE